MVGALKSSLWAATGGKEPNIRPKTILAGRRVIFSWVQTPALPNAGFVGLQSFPRELWLEATTQRLHSKPIAELATLYNGAGENASVQFAKQVARQTSVLSSLIGQHCFNLRLRFTFGGAAQPPVAVAGAATGVTLFDGGGQAAGLQVALAQPACANSSELVQSDLVGGSELASLSPPAAVAANAQAATEWCRTQCCARKATCFGWTSILNASAAASSCRLKGSGAVVGTIGGGGCLASTMGVPGQPDGSGAWRCVSGLRGLELRVDGGGDHAHAHARVSDHAHARVSDHAHARVSDQALPCQCIRMLLVKSLSTFWLTK